MRLGDGEMLDIMLQTRALGMRTMIHAENSEMIDLITKRLIVNAQTLPKNHVIARPQIAESEATHRAIVLSTLTSTPILLVHLSSKASSRSCAACTDEAVVCQYMQRHVRIAYISSIRRSQPQATTSMAM